MVVVVGGLGAWLTGHLLPIRQPGQGTQGGKTWLRLSVQGKRLLLSGPQFTH